MSILSAHNNANSTNIKTKTKFIRSKAHKYFLVAKLLYKSKCPSLCLYVCLSGLGGNVIFSAPNWDIAISLKFFCVQIPLVNENLFCKYFVRLSFGTATKGFATYGFFILVFKYEQNKFIGGLYTYLICRLSSFLHI